MNIPDQFEQAIF